MRKHFLGIVALLLAAACDAPHREQVRIERQWPAAEVQVVDLEGVNGSVHVRRGEGDVQFVAKVNVYGRRDRDRRRASEIVRADVHNGILSVTERSSKRRFNFLWRHHAEVQYELTVPATTRLALETVNGRIDVHGITGELDLVTVNGSIEVATPTADLEARAVNGSIRAVFSEKFQGASLKTVNGSIHVGVPPESSIDYDIHQVNGNFSSDLPIRTVSGFGVREVSDSVNGGEFPLQVTTVNGSISLRENRPASTTSGK